MIDLNPRDLGAVLHYAMRYAFGRFTYAVDDVARLIRQHWNSIDENGREQIAAELAREIARTESHGHVVGADWSHRIWCELRDFTAANLRRQMQEGE
jgi:hypothetical protein